MRLCDGIGRENIFALPLGTETWMEARSSIFDGTVIVDRGKKFPTIGDWLGIWERGEGEALFLMFHLPLGLPCNQWEM